MRWEIKMDKIYIYLYLILSINALSIAFEEDPDKDITYGDMWCKTGVYK